MLPQRPLRFRRLSYRSAVDLHEMQHRGTLGEWWWRRWDVCRHWSRRQETFAAHITSSWALLSGDVWVVHVSSTSFGTQTRTVATALNEDRYSSITPSIEFIGRSSSIVWHLVVWMYSGITLHWYRFQFAGAVFYVWLLVMPGHWSCVSLSPFWPTFLITKRKNKSRLMRWPCCLCVCVSLPPTIELLD
jgi:hypothetical protein